MTAWVEIFGLSAKARQHLEKAVKLAPDYPDNFISLYESYIAWGERDKVAEKIAKARNALEAARQRLTGAFWELSWHDWDNRMKAIESH